ncbi:MAG: hypothetical protein EXR72_05430 [Myxococcales bacterium]|nr:hypothetical protein [Myxococcales bacterium]
MSRVPALLALLSPWAAFAAPPRAPSFDPAQAAPYFSDRATGAGATAMERFHVEDWAGAAKQFDAYLAAHPRADDRRQAAFLGAYALSKSGRFPEAAERFDGLVKSYPLLADYHLVYAARAWLAAKRFPEALERAAKVDVASPLDAEARFVRADALAAAKRTAEAAAAYKAYFDSYPKSWREPEARLRFAESVAELGAERWPEARAIYRDLFVRVPTNGPGRAAEARLKARDPGALRLTGPERLARGLALFEAMRNPESEADLRAALAAGGLDGKQVCVATYHLAQSVFKQRDRPRAAALFDESAAACAKVPADILEAADLHMKALYQGARCHAARGEGQVAADLFARAEASHPSHSYADDARLRQAEAFAELAQRAREAARKGGPTDGGTAADYEARGTALLADLADRYPGGDNRGEALFRLFFRAWRADRMDEAKRWLDETLVKVPREEGWWEAGRTLYWSARVAEKTGHSNEGAALYTRCAREYPLSYYALQALNRLRETRPADERKLAESLRAPAATPADLAWHFAPRALFAEPAFLRGVELARLGLGGEARRELASVGIRAPEKGAPIEGVATEELLWLASVLYDRAGEYALSHWIPRHALTGYARSWPTGPERRRWVLSYPRGYGDLIVPNAQKNGQPEALQFAIVREESAFDPLIESFANAVGLTQLTQPPAKRFSQGLPYTREALRDPAINVTIGARELGYLWKYFDGSGALAIASYNAGEGAVMRWLRAAPKDEPLDAFLESIPYDETRGYTKRVLSSWFAYHWLYGTGDPVPPLPIAAEFRKPKPAPTK